LFVGLAEDGVDGGEEGGEEGGGGGGTRRRRIANKKTKKPRPPLPNKPIDYQLRIHLLEGRALFVIFFSFFFSFFLLSFLNFNL